MVKRAGSPAKKAPASPSASATKKASPSPPSRRQILNGNGKSPGGLTAEDFMKNKKTGRIGPVKKSQRARLTWMNRPQMLAWSVAKKRVKERHGLKGFEGNMFSKDHGALYGETKEETRALNALGPEEMKRVYTAEVLGKTRSPKTQKQKK